MKHTVIALAISACCGFAVAAGTAGTTNDASKAERDRIAADYKAAKARCDTLKANAKDICQAEAKGNEKIAKAELESKSKPGASSDEKLKLAKAEAAYEVAKEKCDDLSGDAKNACVKDAKAAHTSAKNEAKATKSAGKG